MATSSAMLVAMSMVLLGQAKLARDEDRGPRPRACSPKFQLFNGDEPGSPWLSPTKTTSFHPTNLLLACLDGARDP